MDLAARIIPDLAGGTIALTQSERRRCNPGWGRRLARFRGGVLEEIHTPADDADAQAWLAGQREQHPGCEYAWAFFGVDTAHDIEIIPAER